MKNLHITKIIRISCFICVTTFLSTICFSAEKMEDGADSNSQSSSSEFDVYNRHLNAEVAVAELAKMMRRGRENQLKIQYLLIYFQATSTVYDTLSYDKILAIQNGLS